VEETTGGVVKVRKRMEGRRVIAIVGSASADAFR
jgi:hypothetical protein